MEEKMKYVSVRFETTNKTYTFSTTDESIKEDDAVVVETQRGIEYATVVTEPFEKPNVSMEIKPIIRKATKEDLRQFERNKVASIASTRSEEHTSELQSRE